MKMKAALMYGPNDIRVEETDKPICPEDGLILKIMSVGLCGSDIRNLTTDSRKGNYPFIYGHEIVGFVDEVGAKQNKYKVGDRLFLFPGTYCMEWVISKNLHTKCFRSHSYFTTDCSIPCNTKFLTIKLKTDSIICKWVFFI